MEIAYTQDIDTMQLSEVLADRVVKLMKELKIPSIRDSGYTLEDCLLAAADLPMTVPSGIPRAIRSRKEIEAFIKYTYDVY